MRNTQTMTQITLTFEELNALLTLIEFHDDEPAEEFHERCGTNMTALYDKLSEMRDEV